MNRYEWITIKDGRGSGYFDHMEVTDSVIILRKDGLTKILSYHNLVWLDEITEETQEGRVSL